MKIILSLLACMSLAAPLFATDTAPAIDPKEIEAYKKKVGDTTYNKAAQDCGQKAGAAQKTCWEQYIQAANSKDGKPAANLKKDLSATLGKVPDCDGKWVGDKCVKGDNAVGAGKGTDAKGSLPDKCKGKKGEELKKCMAEAAKETSREPAGPAGNLVGPVCKDGEILNNGKCVPNQGTPAPTPAAEKPDPNKWNSTIAGGKMAIWAGLIGFILGGPMGLMLAACVGFGAGYFIKEMS